MNNKFQGDMKKTDGVKGKCGEEKDKRTTGIAQII